MRAFIQKQNQPQQRVSSDITRSSTAAVAVSHQAHPFLHLQTTLGIQAVQRQLQAKPDGLEVGFNAADAVRFAHDFSQIPIHPESPANAQAKLMVSPPGAIYEKEADLVSEQMMRMPDPQDVSPQNGDGKLQRKCSACEKEDEEKHDKLERKELSGASGPTPTVAPAIVHDALSSPGQPLDAGTRAFFEPRFGHDFGHVRIHADWLAEESARAVDAQAYTVKHHVVFGPSQYSPCTLPGRRLLAHELTHVMQQAAASHQLRPADFASSSAESVGSDVLLRKPDKPTQAERRREQKLEELARDPGEAHRAWKKLSEVESSAVVGKMEVRYGRPFARQFLDEVKKGKPQRETRHYVRGVGPKPSELIKKGYQRGWTEHIAADMQLELWVHPTGRYVAMDVGTWKPGSAETKKEPGTKAPPAKLPPVMPQPPEPPLTEEQERALDFLDDLQLRNNQLQDALTSDPFQRKKAQDAQAAWALSRAELRDLKDLDMNNVYPDFWKEVDAATVENTDLLEEVFKRDPSFTL
jgi:hypothetical protein